MANDAHQVRVSEKVGIAEYVMTFRGEIVPTPDDEGEFPLPVGESDYLKWGMIGEPGGSMKVEVLRDGEVVAKRLKSKIPNSRPAGYDRLLVKNP